MIVQHPKFTPALIQKAKVLIQHQDWEQAVELAQRVLSKVVAQTLLLPNCNQSYARLCSASCLSFTVAQDIGLAWVHIAWSCHPPEPQGVGREKMSC